MGQLLKGIVLATVLPTLGGCVTARAGADAILGVPAIGTCASPKASYASAPAGTSGSAGSSTAVADVQLTEAQKKETDLQLGLRLLAAGSSSPRAAGIVGAGASVQLFSQSLFSRLGIDPDGIDIDLDALSLDAADRASKVLVSEPFRKLAPADPSVAASKFGNGDITISRQEWVAMTQDVALATSGEGWVGAAALSLGQYARTHGLVQIKAGSPADKPAQEVTLRLLVARYVSDYFRNGKILTLDLNYPDLKAKLLEKLKHSIKDEMVLTAANAEIDQLAKDYGERLCKAETKQTPCRVLGVLGEQTFVSRAGKSYGFPGLAATVDLTGDKKVSTNKVDPNAVISDLVRVLFEAVGDDRIRVPGAENSSLCRASKAMCSSAYKDVKDIADKLQRVDNIGDRVEAGAFSSVGIAIRGGWLFSINNEALASSVQTAVAVGARKTAEGVMWTHVNHCDATLDSLGSPDTSSRTVKVRLTE